MITRFLDIKSMISIPLTSVLTVHHLRRDMVVKSVRGRRRYIVYRVPTETDRDDVVSALENANDPIPQLKVITCFGGEAVIRSTPDGLSKVDSRMRAAWPDCESIITSGTLRTIRDAHPELKVPRKRKR